MGIVHVQRWNLAWDYTVALYLLLPGFDLCHLSLQALCILSLLPVTNDQLSDYTGGAFIQKNTARLMAGSVYTRGAFTGGEHI